MKKTYQIISFVIIVLLMGSCSEDIQSDKQIIYNLNGVKNFAPVNLFESSLIAVFEDSNGTLKDFTIQFEKREIEKSKGSNKYKTEEIDINLKNNAEEFYMNIHLSSNKIDGVLNEFVISSLYTSNNNGLIPSIKIDSNGEPVICEKINTITLNSKSFNNVYTNFTSPISSNNSHKSLYYTADQGIVGFYDYEGKLWNLKKIE